MGRLAHPIALYVTALACLLAGPAAAQEYCVACSEPGALYRGERLAFEFRRAASRLHEMQGRDYLARPHRP